MRSHCRVRRGWITALLNLHVARISRPFSFNSVSTVGPWRKNLIWELKNGQEDRIGRKEKLHHASASFHRPSSVEASFNFFLVRLVHYFIRPYKSIYAHYEANFHPPRYQRRSVPSHEVNTFYYTFIVSRLWKMPSPS